MLASYQFLSLLIKPLSFAKIYKKHDAFLFLRFAAKKHGLHLRSLAHLKSSGYEMAASKMQK